MTVGPCLDDDTLALLLEGALAGAEAEQARAHLDGCESCRRAVAAAAGSLEGEGPAAPAPKAAPRLEKGAVVGRYLVVGPVGAGGMGSVYAAYDPELDRKVALKLLHPHLGNLEPLIRREAQAMARLSHPNVVAVFDVGRVEDRLFVAMELVEGRSLSSRLRDPGLSWREKVSLLCEAGRGLAAAHAAGVVHGDFKPQNALVGADGRVRVTDFGLARTAPLPAPDAPLSGPASWGSSDPELLAGPRHSPAGTPAFMAPEQLAGGETTKLTDLYAFCASLHLALTGVLPYEGKTPKQLLAAARAGKVQPGLRAGLPAWLLRAVERGLRPEPAERWPSMEALLAELTRVPALARRSALLAGGLAVVALAGAAGWAISQRADPAAECRARAGRVETVWSPARREEVRLAFERSGQPHQADSFARVAATLDRISAAWRGAYAEACRDGFERPEGDGAVWLRMGCLSQQLAAVQARAGLLAAADRALVEEAPALVASLEDPKSCARPLAVPAPVPEPALRPSVERLRGSLAHARSLLEAARIREALAEAQGLAAEARALGWQPLLAEALLLQGDVLWHTDKLAEAHEKLREATLAAEASRHDQVLAQALVSDALLVSEGLQRFGLAVELEERAAAAIARLGGDDDLTAHLEDHLGMRLTRQGHIAEGLAKLQSAKLHHQRTGREDRFSSWLLNDEATALHLGGRLAEAAPLFAQAAALKERLLGPFHPDVAISLSNLGGTLLALGRPAEAEAPLLRAEQIVRQQEPPEPLQLVALSTNLGDLALALGRPAEAERRYRTSLAVAAGASLEQHQNTCDAVNGLGRALLALGRPEEALPALEAELPRAGPLDPVTQADLRFTLARALAAAKRDPARARRLAENARDTYRSEQRSGADSVSTVEAWLAQHP